MMSQVRLPSDDSCVNHEWCHSCSLIPLQLLCRQVGLVFLSSIPATSIFGLPELVLSSTVLSSLSFLNNILHSVELGYILMSC